MKNKTFSIFRLNFLAKIVMISYFLNNMKLGQLLLMTFSIWINVIKIIVVRMHLNVDSSNANFITIHQKNTQRKFISITPI